MPSFPRRRESRSVGAETYRINSFFRFRTPDSRLRGNDGGGIGVINGFGKIGWINGFGGIGGLKTTLRNTLRPPCETYVSTHRAAHKASPCVPPRFRRGCALPRQSLILPPRRTDVQVAGFHPKRKTEKENDMKKTPKRHLLRHTAIYTAMLLVVSSQQAFGASDSANFNFIVNDDGSVEGGQIPGGKGVRPGEKFSPSKGQKGFPKGGYACQRLNIPSNGGCPVLISIYHKFDFTNTDTLLAGKTGKLTFGGVGGGSAPLWGKFSGLNADNLAGPKPDDWLTTTHKGKMGYDFSGISCYTEGKTGQSRQCPNLPFRFNFNFEGSALNPNSVKTSPDGLPIYMLKDHPWLGVSFQLGISTDNGARNWMAVNGNNTEIKQRIAKPTDDNGIGEVFELRAKLHPLGDPKNLPAQEIKLGQINMPDFGFVPVGSGGSGRSKTFYDIFEHGHIDVKLQLPDIDAAAGGCTQAQYTNPAPDGGQYAIVAPAPLGAGFPDRAAAVVTDPKSASSRILFYTLNKDNKKNGGADYLPSKDFTEPVFTGRKAAIRLANGGRRLSGNRRERRDGAYLPKKRQRLQSEAQLHSRHDAAQKLG